MPIAVQISEVYLPNTGKSKRTLDRLSYLQLLKKIKIWLFDSFYVRICHAYA
jgi:hypothetical protein